MVIGIDISNIRRGGGVTHIVNILNEYACKNAGDKIIVWGGSNVLEKINDQDWLIKINHPVLERNLFFRFFWQIFYFSNEAKDNKCDILFIPGGTFLGRYKPFVTMSQNLLPFEIRELKRFGFSSLTIKFFLLSLTQRLTFRKSAGMIFLSEYAHDLIFPIFNNKKIPFQLIPHGINKSFYNRPKEQRPFKEFTRENPCKIVYVSIIDMYKHQWHVAEAVSILRKKGFNVDITFIGPYYKPALKKLQKKIQEVDTLSEYIHYKGAVLYENLNNELNKADIFLFASSCENMPNILIEGMASGLPIVCTNKKPMIDILRDGGLYFDCEKPFSIAETIEKMMTSVDLRIALTKKSFEYSIEYSWQECSNRTFDFIHKVFQINKMELNNKE